MVRQREQVLSAVEQASIQRLPVAEHADEQGDEGKQPDLPELQGDVGKIIPLQQHSAYDAQEVRQWQHLADVLRPLRHAPEGKHEAGEQQRRQEEKE